MSDGFLDEVEKVIDDFSLIGTKKINKDIDPKIEKGHRHFWEYGRHEREYKTISNPINCKCGVEMTVYTSINTYFHRDEYMEYDTFYCAKCGTMWRINGKIISFKCNWK